MKKRCLRVMAGVLALLLATMCIPAVVHAEDAATDESYRENIRLLNTFMCNDPSNPVDIAALRLRFQSLHHYQLSTEFSLYAQIMEYLEKDDVSNASSWLSVLVLYPEFDAFVTGEEFSRQFPAIRGLKEMEAYISGRREEMALNYNAASVQYKSCLKFYDTMERYQNLHIDLDTVVAETLEQVKRGEYAAAIENAEYLIACGHEHGQALYDVAVAQKEAAMMTPVPVLTATPVPVPTSAPAVMPVATPKIEVAAIALKASYSNSEVVLAWNSVLGAEKYIVYHATNLEVGNTLAVLAETTSTKSTDTSVKRGMNKYYYVEAVDQYGNVIGRSDIQMVRAVSTTWSAWSSWSTNKVSENNNTQVASKVQYRSRTKSTKNEYSSMSGWSSWSTEAVSSSDTREVETQVQYRYRDQTMVYSEWSAWGNWTFSRKTIADSNLMQEETGTKAHWWAAKCLACGRHNPYWGSSTKCVGCGQYLPKSNYQNASYYSDDTTGGSLDGRSKGRVYNGKHYWYHEMRKVYRYRTRTCSDGWSAWSAWSSAVVPGATTRQVEMRTVYRYRTRSVQQVTVYGNWSDWSDTVVQPNSTTEVEKRTVYRYRKLQ